MMWCTFTSSVILVWIGTAVARTPSVTIASNKVTYRGTVSDSVEHFQNIKYAYDTSGHRRFAPPEPFAPAPNTIVEASSPGPSCPQIKDAMPPFFSEAGEMSEDCLHLRIARPSNTTPKSKLPVVVWLHGGGVVKGSAYDPHFDPDKLIKLSVADGKPIIYAAINYRLSIFGFARLPPLKDQKSLNAGMRDQRMGFQWIKDYIEAFGGDPGKITVFGLSAGGTFISMHPMVYGGEKGVPFQSAWMMSGPPGTALNMTSTVTADHTIAVAEKVGCTYQDQSKILECLRKVPMKELLDTAMAYSIANHPPAGLFTFIPSIDDDFFPESQSQLVTKGKFVKGMNAHILLERLDIKFIAGIRMIFGWTQDDGAMNAGPAHLINNEDDMIAGIKQFAHALTPKHFTQLFSLYSAEDFQEELMSYQARKTASEPDISVHYFRLSRILRDLLFTCSSIDFGYQMVKQTRTSLDPGFDNVRLYALNQSALTPMWKAAGMPYVSVCHGSDTNYIFNGIFPEGEMESKDEELSRELARNLINFATTGNPSIQSARPRRSLEWPASFPLEEASNTQLEATKFNMQVIGGPLGTGPAFIREGNGKEWFEEKNPDFYDAMENSEHYMNFGEMESAISYARQRQVQHEKLIERCRYISSLAEPLGV